MSADRRAIEALLRRPAALGRRVGFTLLRDDLHGAWLERLLRGEGDMTLQAHRGSCKTTCVALAMAVNALARPELTMAFLRKTDDDAREVIATVKKILTHPFTRALALRMWGRPAELTRAGVLELHTSLARGPRGTPQITGLGIGGSLTGRHFDIIFTDDIVNLQDRIYHAERERTKLVYQELLSVKNRGGRIINTGTPWHPEDAFTLMPPPERYDCYTTGLIEPAELERLRSSMLPSLFAANYELKHIAPEDVLFRDPALGADISLCEGGLCHLDAAYGGADATAFTVCRRRGDTYYVLGRLWQAHVEEVLPQIAALQKRLCAGRILCENNADRGFVADRLRRLGAKTAVYHESMNKALKITTYLCAAWKRIVFVEGTDPAYLTQLTDFREGAPHDDAPDSLASVLRALWNRPDPDTRTLPELFRD